MANLPNDVMTLIVAEADKGTIKQLRLCCKWLAQEGVRHIFATIRCEMLIEDMERVVSIANSPARIASAVKTIELRQSRRLRAIEHEEWCDDVSRGWDRTESDESDEDGSDEDDEDACRQLFQEYEAQRTESTLYNCLHAAWPQKHDRLAGREKPPPENLRRFQHARIGFEEALLKLPNLEQFSAFFPWCFRWRGHYFRKVHGLSDPEVSEHVAPLAFGLRSLGKRNAVSTSLASMKLCLGELSLWSLQGLDQAWVSPDGGRPEIAAPLMNNQSAFSHLTDLNLDFEHTKHRLGSLKALAWLLNTTRKLVRLKIRLFRVGMDDWPDLDMLKKIINAKWPMLEELRLEGFIFTTDSLLRLLSLLTQTLKSLELHGCALIGAHSTWVDFYTQMRLLPFERLCHLNFGNCNQEVEDLRGKPRPYPSCGHVGDDLSVMHRMEGGYTASFSSKIYDYILKETDIMPPLLLYPTFC